MRRTTLVMLICLASCASTTIDEESPGRDAGTSVVDAGAIVVDAGTTPVDAGEVFVDAGTTPVDAGEPEVDAGPTVTFPPAGMRFHEIWENPATPPASATNGYWTAQYDFVANAADDAIPDLSASSATLHTFTATTETTAPEGIATRGGSAVFQRNDGCCVINAPASMETHPAWAIDKTFTAPFPGWFHLSADGVTHFQCNVAADKASWGDGVLLEVYRVHGATTDRIWATLVPGRSCDPIEISLTEFLDEGDRLIVRGATHSGDSRLDGLNIDPLVRLVQPYGTRSAPPCSASLTAHTDGSNRQGEISAAIANAAAMVNDACPRAEVLLGPGDYAIDGPISFGADAAHVTLRGDSGSARARILTSNRTGHILDMFGHSNELRGLVIDAATIGGVLQSPFTQGVIEARDVDGSGGVTAVDVRIDPGFDDALDTGVWQSGPSVQGVVFSSAGAAKTYAWLDGAGRSFTRRGERWHLAFAPRVSFVGVGDRIAITARGFDGSLHIEGRENRLTDVTLHVAAGLAVRSNFATGFHARRFVIEPGPNVGGKTRLISTNADGLHLKNLRRGATVEDCVFAGIPEDAINTHADGQWLTDPWFEQFQNRADDWYLVYRSSTLQPGNAGLFVQPLTTPTTAGLAPFGDRVFNISASGEGTLIRRSKFHELRGNGIVLRGGIALVTSNAFWNVFGGADDAGNNAFARAVNIETSLAPCANQQGCGGNDEGPYAYGAYVRHNTFLAGDPATGNTWHAGLVPVVRNQTGAEGCWPWSGNFTPLCYPENQDGVTLPIVIGPNP